MVFLIVEGYGKYLKGGWGGVVYYVINLKDSGKGSLRVVIEVFELRIVVFDVLGNIELESFIKIEYLYVIIVG